MCRGKSFAGLMGVALIGLLGLTGCGKKPQISLSMWGATEDQEMLNEMVETFKEEYKDDAEFEITVSAEDPVTCKETVLTNPEVAADVYAFADDQFESLYDAGVLLEITENVAGVEEANGGADSAAILSAKREGKLYAYPMTASNGYFMYYNSAYFSEEDLESLDRMMEIAAENDKTISIDFTSGWYLYSFFKGAGLDVERNEDGKTNICNWNATDTRYTGKDVAEAIERILAHKGTENGGDEDFINGVKSGRVIAGINGAWNAAKVEAAYGENYAATKLPTYTVAGDQVQMASFAGYKLVGVSAYSKEPEWAMKLAEWITNEENQTIRFERNGECPSNVKAGASEKVLNAPAIAALSKQADYAYVQDVADSFWMPVNVFGTTLVAQDEKNYDLQELLDQMVKGITNE